MDHDALDLVPGTHWMSRLRRIADDVDLGLPPRATANALRAVVEDMVRDRHRASVLSDVCGARW